MRNLIRRRAAFRRSLRPLAALFLLLIAAGSGSGAAPEKLAVTAKVEALGKGRGKLVVTFQPNPAYDFNRTPPITVQVEGAAGIEWDRTRQVPKDGKPIEGSQYFGRILPVEFVYTLAPAARPEARVKVTYFYCSKKDGYCAREEKPLVVPLTATS